VSFHARKQIRDAVGVLLRAGKSPNWNHVISERLLAQRQLWPYVMVYSESDIGDPNVNNPAAQLRELSLIIRWVDKLPGNNDRYTIEDKMDAAAAEIETRLTTTAMVAQLSLVKQFTLVDTALDVVEVDDEPDRAELTLNWQIVYATMEGNPVVLI
jgi:hypothetical protein